MKDGDEESGSGTESDKDARQAKDRTMIELLQAKRDSLNARVKQWQHKCEA